eukprot:TRINITY_DN84774_c0_g1_i2.p1 TRINITY_DN84774_c0_g1~~TRINITY_DN84774_c0_g1_i2.p1  ORF type:complete len:256 (+),score=50.41 TRINITY_DN84774_c0_g1_i2:114-881(+)
MAMANGVAASMTGQRAGGDVDPDPGGSSEALQPPLRSFRFQSKFDRFKGRWLRGYEGESVATVYSAGVLVWAEGYGGARSQLEVLGPNTVTMELEGQRYFGTMGQPPAEPTQLLWSDGEIWSPEVEPSLWETYSGNWVQADGSCAQCGSICRGVLTWATGYGVTESTLDLTSKGRKTILVLRQGNDVVTAQLSDNLEDGLKQLLWSDGDVWQQRTRLQSVAPPLAPVSNNGASPRAAGHDIAVSSLVEAGAGSRV